MRFCWKCGDDAVKDVVENFESNVVDVFKWRCECGATNIRRDFHKVNGLLVLGGNRLVGSAYEHQIEEVVGKYEFDWLFSLGTRGAADQAVTYSVIQHKKALVSWPYKKRDGGWKSVFAESFDIGLLEIAHPEYANPKHPVYQMYGREGDFMAPVKKVVIELATIASNILVFDNDPPHEDIIFDVLHDRRFKPKVDVALVDLVKQVFEPAKQWLIDVPF